jgi:hypothetical protein
VGALRVGAARPRVIARPGPTTALEKCCGCRCDATPRADRRAAAPRRR